MTGDGLRGLIAAGETLDVEFKGEERDPLNDRDLVEAVVCLANRGGTQPGWLLVGVEDDGRVTRKGAAALCRVTGPPAYRVLKRLAGRGRGLMAGAGSWGRGVGNRGVDT